MTEFLIRTTAGYLAPNGRLVDEKADAERFDYKEAIGIIGNRHNKYRQFHPEMIEVEPHESETDPTPPIEDWEDIYL